MMTRTYSELIRLPTFEERLAYLSLVGYVGETTFGFDRYLNQRFYTSVEWKKVRNDILVRDQYCDLACPDQEILYRPIVHHMNPVTLEQLEQGDPNILNPEFLICVSNATHEMIHFGKDLSSYSTKPIERFAGDTTPWL